MGQKKKNKFKREKNQNVQGKERVQMCNKERSKEKQNRE